MQLQGCAFLFCKDINRGVVPLVPPVVSPVAGDGGGGAGGGDEGGLLLSPLAAAFAPEQRTCQGYTTCLHIHAPTNKDKHMHTQTHTHTRLKHRHIHPQKHTHRSYSAWIAAAHAFDFVDLYCGGNVMYHGGVWFYGVFVDDCCGGC